MADITPNTANPVREDAYVTELATKLGIDAKYIPKSPTWRNEEEIKVLADLFANMSAGGGSGGGGLVVTVDVNDYPEKTYAEIVAAAAEGPVILKYTGSDGLTRYYYLAYTGWDDMSSAYMVCFSDARGNGDMFEYGAETQDGAWTSKVIPS